MIIKNCNILKSSSSYQNINNNNPNDINIIYENQSKNNIKNINHRQHRLKNELTWSQNQLINNSINPNSPLKMKKLNVKNNNNIKKIKI
jgi:hypothetical protein